MNETIAKLAKQLTDIHAAQEAAIKAAEAEGVSDDDRAKHLAEFDKLQKDKDKVNASLTRARQLEADRVRESNTPVGQIVQQVNNPMPAVAGAVRIPATLRRPASLKAFKGPDAQERAYQAGLWAAAALYNHQPSRDAYQAQFGPLATTLSNSSNTGAAYFVPNVLEMTILELTEQFGIFRRLADIQPMTSDTWSGPRWTGGMTAYFVAEGSAPTQSDPAWDLVELTTRMLAAMSKMTRILDEDSLIDLGDKVAMAGAIAFAEKEDQCGFNGDGTSTYGGMTGLFTQIIASANAASLYTATGHTTLGAITVNDYAAVVGLLPNWANLNPAWLVHKTVWANSMVPLQLAAGGATPMDIANGGRPTFMGYPVEFVNVAPKSSAVTTGVTGILLGDIKVSSKFGDRRGRTFETGLINDDFTKQLMTFLITERFHIVNHTMTDPKNSSNPGPVIGLKLG